MTIKISSTFLNDLNNYAEYLINEGVTKDIVNERVENIKSFINTLTKNPLYYPICRYKDLGQEFSENKEFIHQNLRQESYYPTKNKKVYWAFSFFFNENDGTIVINRMVNSLFIKENKTYKTMNRIRLTESQLHKVIIKCINETLDSEDKVQKAVKALISILPVVEEAGTSCTFDGYDADPRLCELIIEANRVIDVLYRYVSEKSKTVFDKDRERFD